MSGLSRNVLEKSFYAPIFAFSSLGVIAVISGVSNYPDAAGGRVSLVFIIGGFALLMSIFPYLGNLRSVDLNKPSEVFTFSFISIITFIFSQAVLYLISGIVGTFDSALLESTSGITTTAISSLDPESLSSAVLVFRSLTQWFGGLCALFLVFVATPISSGGDNPSAGYGPKIFSRRATRRMQEILLLYLGLTSLTFLGLLVAGMGTFDSLSHAMTTSSTGGFSTRSSSIASFQSASIEWVLICGMFLGGMNLGILWWLCKRKISVIRSNNELRLYLLMFLGGAMMFWLKGDFTGSFGSQSRDALFKMSSIFSTTGFTNQNWEFSSGISAIALLVMATGGMAGSAGGGYGVHRLIELVKYLRRELTRKYNRQAVRKIKVSGEVLDERVLDKLQGFTAIFIFIVASGSFLLSLSKNSLNIVDAIAISLSAFVTAGPPITEAGLVTDFGVLGHITLVILMIIGRLSIFPAAFMMLKLAQILKINIRSMYASDEIES